MTVLVDNVSTINTCHDHNKDHKIVKYMQHRLTEKSVRIFKGMVELEILQWFSSITIFREKFHFIFISQRFAQ